MSNDDSREERRLELLDALARDTRHALRSIARSPAFAAISVLTLALGIGATTAIFAMLDRVALRPLPYPAAERLVWLESEVPGMDRERAWGLSMAGYFHFAEHASTLGAIGAFVGTSANLAGSDGADRVRAALVSASFFDVIGARAAQGRLLRPEENLPRSSGRDPAPVVVLGYDFWRTRYDADPRVVGRTIEVNSSPREVVGVLAPGIHLPEAQVDIWAPLWMDPTARPVNSHYLQAVARLAPGATLDEARAQLAQLTARFPELFPTAYDEDFMRTAQFATGVKWLKDRVLGTFTTTLWILLASVGLVLLVACANVANLFLVRTEARRREITVRAALGANRARLALHSVTEGVLLALAAGVLGIALAWGATRTLLAVAPSGIPRLAEVGIGWPSVLFALALSVVAGAVFGLFPIVRLGSGFDALRESSRGSTSSRRQHLVRGTLVVAQVALAVVLLAAAGLMLQSFRHLRDVDPGFEPEGVLTMEISLPGARYPSYEAVSAFHRNFLSALAALPGVESAGGASGIPLDGGGGCSSVFVEEGPARELPEPPCVGTPTAAPGFFETLGIEVQGRTPDWSDIERGTGAVVVTKSLAERLWPGEEALGKGIRGNGPGAPYYRVVGVTESVRSDGLDKPALEAVYFPLVPLEGAPLWSPLRGMSVVVRTRVERPELLAASVRRILTEMDPAVPLANVRTMETVVARSTARTSFAMLLLGVAAGMALLLSAVGIYGVISYIVSQRRGEIGIRLALGARMGQVVGLVVGQSLALAAVGVAIGLLGAIVATRSLRSLLFEVQPGDPVVLAAVAALLVTLAALASLAPARRAARVDPVEALRGD